MFPPAHGCAGQPSVDLLCKAPRETAEGHGDDVSTEAPPGGGPCGESAEGPVAAQGVVMTICSDNDTGVCFPEFLCSTMARAASRAATLEKA